jgi:hypothetical protein
MDGHIKNIKLPLNFVAPNFPKNLQMAKVKKPVKMLPIIKFYLIVYNILSFYGWGALLYRTVDHLLVTQDPYTTQQQVGHLTSVIQSVAILEVMTANSGLSLCFGPCKIIRFYHHHASSFKIIHCLGSLVSIPS